MFIPTIDTVFPDRNNNVILKEMFKIIEYRKINPLQQIFPVSARPKNYIQCAKHHIIPRSWYYQTGFPVNNNENNIICVSIIEHIQIHMFLAEYFREKNDITMYNAMSAAVSLIYGQNSSNADVYDYCTVQKPEISRQINDTYTRLAKMRHEKMTGLRFANNGEICIRLKESDELPAGFEWGYLKLNACLKWITNGIYEKRIKFEDTVPNGWTVGRKKTVSEKLKVNNISWGDQCRNKKWYNNGTCHIKLLEGETPPAGFVPGKIVKLTKIITNGKTDRHLKDDDPIPDGWMLGSKSKGKICVNNGIKNIRVFPDKIPKGYKIGRLHSNAKDRIAMSNDQIHQYKMVQKNEIQQYIKNGYVKGNHIKKWLAEGYIKVPGNKNKGKYYLP